MKLVAAKCPSCGASIDVDKDSDSTKCEYCHSKIFVEEAIAKVKVDVEIKNLPAYEDYVKLADRYYSEFLYREARTEYKKALELNPTDSKLLFREKICRACSSSFNKIEEKLIVEAFEEIRECVSNKEEQDSYIFECLNALVYIVNKTIKYYNSNSLNSDEVIDVHYKVLSCANNIKFFDGLIDLSNGELRLMYLETYIPALHLLTTDLIYRISGTRRKNIYCIPYKEKKEYVSKMNAAKNERKVLLENDKSLISKSTLHLPKTNYFSVDISKYCFIGLLIFNVIACAIFWSNESYLIAILCGAAALYQGKNLEKLNREPYSIRNINITCTAVLIIAVAVFFILRDIPGYVAQWKNDNMMITINQGDAALKFSNNKTIISGEYKKTCDSNKNCKIKLSTYTFYYSNNSLCFMENDKCTQTLKKTKDVTYIPVTDKDKVCPNDENMKCSDDNYYICSNGKEHKESSCILESDKEPMSTTTLIIGAVLIIGIIAFIGSLSKRR